MLRNQNISLRAVEPSDIDLLYTWENDTQNWFVSSTITPFGRHIIEQFVEQAKYDIYTNKQLRLMIDWSSNTGVQTIGCIDLFDFDIQHKKAGVGILIAEEANRGKGYATMALKLFVEYGFKVLQLHQLYCGILETNSASIQLFEQAGFVLSGVKKDWVNVQGKWQDELFYQLIDERRF